MKFTVQNVARVSLAKIELGGITVMAGANGTGKSTISRALMTLCSVSGRIPELVQNERIRSIYGFLRESFGRHGGDVFIPNEYFDVRKYPELSSLLSHELWDDFVAVRTWFESGSGNLKIFLYPQDFLEKQECTEALLEAKDKILGMLDRSEVEYAGHACKKSFERAFCGQIAPVFRSDGESRIHIGEEEDPGASKNGIVVAFTNGKLDRFAGLGRILFPSVMYFEPLNYVDFINVPEWRISDRYTAGGLCVCRAVTRKPSKNLSLEQDKELQDAVQSVKEIVGTIRGRLVDDADQEIKFAEKFSNGEFMIDVKNIASGMKTMAAIVRAVENRSIQRGSMLIIDEPESNLHPEWQVQFAHFLVLLSKRLNITLLLNTHSPYFLQAIRKYSKISEVKSHYYNMTFDGNGDSFHTESVSDRIDVVFKTMSKPFNDLMAM